MPNTRSSSSVPKYLAKKIVNNFLVSWMMMCRLWMIDIEFGSHYKIGNKRTCFFDEKIYVMGSINLDVNGCIEPVSPWTIPSCMVHRPIMSVCDLAITSPTSKFVSTCF